MTENTNQDAVIDVESDERKFTEMLESYERQSLHSSMCSIYRIPDNLRTLNEPAYIPQVVSIGPFHHNNPAIQTMERHKAQYYKAFLHRTKTNLQEFLNYIGKQEHKVRCCYAEPIEVVDFRSMVLLDGIFIIAYFMMKTGKLRESTDTLYQPLNIKSDLILLENQLPFFLLEGLYNLAFPSKDEGLPSFLELACKNLSWHNDRRIDPELKVEHFTDLLRKFLLPPPKSKIEELRSLVKMFILKEVQWPKSATELREAGVKFRVGENKSLCDIQFKKGVLEIPCFKFQSNTESFIRNLMAWEQSHYGLRDDMHICHYFFFLDNLINTAKDVDILIKNGIIINWLGDSNAVANLVNGLPKNVLYNVGFYDEICESLNAHCDFGWHKWKVAFKRDYLSTPWKIASTIAAVILLVLTLIQTICSIISLSVS